MIWPGGLYGSGMDEFILREAELGTRVAVCQDDEDNGFGPWLDLLFEEEA